MKFYLVDRIERIEPGKRIVAIKNLSLAEEYLADHFPTFPVLPGVMMLEALVQTAAWLLRVDQNWANSLIVLSAARNMKYASFVAPGHTLRTDLELLSVEGNLAKFKGAGYLETGDLAVQGRLEIQSLNVADVNPAAARTGADARILADLKRQWSLVGGPAALDVAKAQEQ
jgi:3-hydroxyacyl-[acyl-carrier-protein] dehydratase